MILIFNDNLHFKNREIPRAILGNAPFLGEPFFGHRARLYQLDLHRNPENISKIIIEAYEQGVRAINLSNDDNLLKAYDLAVDEGYKMKVVATIGKSEVDYMMPNYDVAKEVDWEEDIEIFSSYDTPIMLVDEFIVDGYDWNLTSEILEEINRHSLSGLITSFPNKTTNLIKENLDLDLFDFYMIPLNKLAYMMDLPSFLPSEREEFTKNISELDKKIIASRVLAAGIQMPEEAFNFIKTLDFVDLITVGVASKQEAKEDFEILFSK